MRVTGAGTGHPTGDGRVDHADPVGREILREVAHRARPGGGQHHEARTDRAPCLPHLGGEQRLQLMDIGQHGEDHRARRDGRGVARRAIRRPASIPGRMTGRLQA
jgi:hypothetical protein